MVESVKHDSAGPELWKFVGKSGLKRLLERKN